MKRVRFTATENMKTYSNAQGLHFNDGDEYNVKDEQAIYLCNNFKNFMIVMSEKENNVTEKSIKAMEAGQSSVYLTKDMTAHKKQSRKRNRKL